MSIDEIRKTYFAECADLLADLEDGLFSISSGDVDIETVNSIFRAVHSIKGGAGAFGLDQIAEFAHTFENGLDIVRKDISSLSEGRVSLLSQCADKLSDLVSNSEAGRPTEGIAPLKESLAREFSLEGGSGGSGESEPQAPAELDFTPVAISLDDLGGNEELSGYRYRIYFKPKHEMYLNGHDAQRLLADLREMGELEVVCDTSAIPPLDEFDSRASYLGWTLNLVTESDITEIEAIFDWVEGLCDLEIEAVDDSGNPQEMLDVDSFFSSLSDFDSAAPEDEAQEAAPGISGLSLPAGLTLQEDEAAEPDDAEIQDEAHEAAENKAADSPEPAAQNAANAEGKDKGHAKSIRVESGKVDRLINLMGELVISQSMLAERISEAGIEGTAPSALALNELQNLTREIQSSVMSIRAQPIKPVFMRMSRVLRETCSMTGKKANLHLDGEFTEVDTTVIEGLVDPLTHMIRNAVDHGIESADERVAKGKEDHGQVKLSASHGSGRITIVLSDDGKGIDRARVSEKARKLGIITSSDEMSDADIDQLIMAPGFSTAETISDVSGRGVGMDVVRQSIQALGGRLAISSEPGFGTTFTISLPLTLAILDGMLVRSSDQVFVLPISNVIETLIPGANELMSYGTGNRCIRLRNELVPIVDVSNVLGFTSQRTDFTDCIAVVVEGADKAHYALILDSIEAQQQVVIKSLDGNYGQGAAFSAATILGNGRIALILDVDGLIASAVESVSLPQRYKIAV
ncbi:MAG: chemotaxis protein CheA [Nitratireductor sp.]|nr:chemotaxis protein CheA [Nitratireductor sp.]MCC0019949.1 chemotaxis protein CheA [Nitratireductor sp.]